MVSKNILYGAEARKLMLAGIMSLENAVTVTLGPKGRMVCLDKGKEYPVITKDGVSVSREVHLSNRIQETGASIVKEAAERTNTNAGDGTTTTIFLSSELCKEGVKLVESGFDPVEVQRGFDLACKETLNVIKDYSKVIESIDDIEHVAFVSANNDEEVGKIVRQAYEGLGEGGIVKISDSHSKSGTTTVEFSTGLEFDKGTKRSGYFTNLKNETYEAENPLFIFCNCPVTAQFIQEPLKIAFRLQRPLVVFSEEVEDEAETLLLRQAKNKSVRCCQLPPPGFTLYEQQEYMKDLIAILGGKLVENTSEEVTEDYFGTCGNVTISTKKTVLSETHPKDEDIEARSKQIDEEIAEGLADTSGTGISDEELEALKTRKANLTGGVATIYVGANSVTRIKELFDRYEDAIRAVRAAMEDGIVPGGGTTLLKCAHELEEKFDNYKFKTRDQEVAFKEFLNVLKLPMTQIIKSVSNDYAYIITEVAHKKSKVNGYNAKTQKYIDDMFKEGIVDPLKVEVEALANSTAVAGSFITTECIISPNSPNVSLEANDPIAMRDPDFNAFGVM